LQKIKAPPEVSDIGVFSEWLSDYCTDRAAASRREDILRGVAWYDEEKGQYWFQLKSFMDFLRRNRHDIRGLGRNKIAENIRSMGGAQHQLVIKPGVGRSCFYVPAGSLEHAVPISAPPKMEEPI
jgi:hypothetical protein